MGNTGFFSAKKLIERLYLHGLFELSMIFQDLGSMVFRAVEKASYDIIKIYRFTKLIFGLSQSPYILEDSFKKHLKLKYTSENYIGMFRELIERVKDDMYVEDLVTGGESTNEVDKIKGDSINLFQRGGFTLHKSHSNEQALETIATVNENELNVAKQHLGTKPKENKILGVLWDKREDSFIIQVQNVNKNATKRNILSTLASIYDPLRFVSPCLLLGNIIYHNLCDLKVTWDKEAPIDIQTQWLKWITGLKT